jgi:hypothetical protein
MALARRRACRIRALVEGLPQAPPGERARRGRLPSAFARLAGASFSERGRSTGRCSGIPGAGFRQAWSGGPWSAASRHGKRAALSLEARVCS